MNAYDRCVDNTKNRFGSKLITYYMDSHSSRYNPKKDRFLIVLQVRTGSVDKNSSSRIVCKIKAKGLNIVSFQLHSAERNKGIFAGISDYFKK
jgi:hypothetical protein